MAGAGFKTFSAGAVLTAAEVNTYLMQQSVMVFGGTAARSSAIPSPSEGMVTYLSDLNDIQAYDGSNWISTGLTAGTTTANYGWPIPASGSIASLGTAIDTTVAGLGSGLNLVKTQTIGSGVSFVEVTDAFSSTYDNYYISISSGTGPTDYLRLQLGSSTSSYYNSALLCRWDGSNAMLATNNGSYWTYAGGSSSNFLSFAVTLINPFLAKYTMLDAFTVLNDSTIKTGGIHQSATSYTSFKITPNSGTLTGGTIRVYGFENS